MGPDLDPRRHDNLPAAADKRARGELQIVAYASVIPNTYNLVQRREIILNSNIHDAKIMFAIPFFPDDVVVQARIDTTGNDARVEAPSNPEDVVVIYNRVPKTASTSFVGLVYDLCKQNKYHVLHINVTNNMHTLTLANQVLHPSFWDNSHIQLQSAGCSILFEIQ